MAPETPDQPPLNQDALSAEIEAPEDPAPRAQPLQHSDKADVGCLILLFGGFVGIFLLPAMFLLGGAPLIVPLISILILLILTPLVNPAERMAGPAKWWGRVICFLVMAACIVALLFWLRSLGETLPGAP